MCEGGGGIADEPTTVDHQCRPVAGTAGYQSGVQHEEPELAP